MKLLYYTASSYNSECKQSPHLGFLVALQEQLGFCLEWNSVSSGHRVANQWRDGSCPWSLDLPFSITPPPPNPRHVGTFPRFITQETLTA